LAAELNALPNVDRAGGRVKLTGRAVAGRFLVLLRTSDCGLCGLSPQSSVGPGRQRSRYYCDLPSGIASPVREKPVVVAPRAGPIDGDSLDARSRCLLGDQRSQVDVPRTDRWLSGQLFADVSADFVAAAANRGSKVDCELRCGDAESLEGLYRFRRNSRGCSPPARVEKPDGAGRVCDEDGDAIGDSNGERGAAVTGNVAVRLSGAEPAIPPAGVEKNPIAVHLSDGNEPWRDVSQVVLHGGPATHHLIDGLRANQAEGSGISGSRKGANTPRIELGDRLFFYLTHRYERRSSTREIDAPSAVNLSSMRSYPRSI